MKSWLVPLVAVAFASAHVNAQQPIEVDAPHSDRDFSDTLLRNDGGSMPTHDEHLLRPSQAPESNWRDGWERDGALAVRGFAACLAEHRNTRSREYLAAPPYSEISQEAVDRIAGRRSSCLFFSDYRVGLLRMQDQALRGALSEAMYLRDYAEHPPAGLSIMSERGIAQEEFAMRMESSPDPGQEVIRMFAECLTNRQPTLVDSLMRTEFRSKEEADVMQLLSPSMNPCLFEGQQLSIGRENLRFALADALYRRVTSTMPIVDTTDSIGEATE